jgi:hypothetical protein
MARMRRSNGSARGAVPGGADVLCVGSAETLRALASALLAAISGTSRLPVFAGTGSLSGPHTRV